MRCVLLGAQALEDVCVASMFFKCAPPPKYNTPTREMRRQRRARRPLRSTVIRVVRVRGRVRVRVRGRVRVRVRVRES